MPDAVSLSSLPKQQVIPEIRSICMHLLVDLIVPIRLLMHATRSIEQTRAWPYRSRTTIASIVHNTVQAVVPCTFAAQLFLLGPNSNM